jgi:hypothetical protein
MQIKLRVWLAFYFSHATLQKGPKFGSCTHGQDPSEMNSSLVLRQRRTVASWLWRRIFSLLLSVVPPVTCSALEIRRVQTCSGTILRLRGDIREGDFSKLKSHFRKKEAIVGFDLSSDGGILEEGLRIADLIRRKKLAVYVTEECNSVCADVFFAAAKRHFAADSKIGVHAVSNYRDIEDAGSKLLTIRLARLWAGQGVPNSIIGKMVSTPPKTITYLDRADLLELHASEGNPFSYKAEGPSEAGQAQRQSCATSLHAGGGANSKDLN